MDDWLLLRLFGTRSHLPTDPGRAGHPRRWIRSGDQTQIDHAAGRTAETQNVDAVMSRLVIPVSSLILWSTGDLRLWIELPVLVKTSAGGWVPEDLRVDTATDVTTFPAFQAMQLNLPVPQSAAVGAV